MKRTLSYKELSLVAGILVAIIIVVLLWLNDAIPGAKVFSLINESTHIQELNQQVHVFVNLLF